MIEYLTDNIVVISEDEVTNDKIKTVDFRLNKVFFKKNYPALRIDFRNNLPYSILCIRKLNTIKKFGQNFSSSYEGKNVKYVISNYNQEIIDSLKAIEILDRKEKYTFIYETLCDELDAIWTKFNPCNFCNGYCAASMDDDRYNDPNGCCAKAFDLSFWTEPFALLKKEDMFPCPYLGENGCTTRNLACKLFVCPYIKKNNLIELNPREFILYEGFFSPKQKLIVTYNYFRSKEQLIDKLIEKDYHPYYIYSSRMKYLILDKNRKKH